MKILFFLFFLFFSVQTAFATCGIIPTTPVTPLGCTGHLVPVCVCDNEGNCYYQWVCSQ